MRNLDSQQALVKVGYNFYLPSNSSGSGPSLKYGGADFAAGQAGGWTLIGAEQTATGYEVARKVTGPDQYGVWTTDSSGKYISNNGVVSGTSSTLESLETSFHQDLNGDRTIGVVAVAGTVIEAFGSTSLTESGNHFYLNNSSGSGPSLKYGGADFVAGQAAGWTPIGAETATGYEVAWKVTGSDQYGVWTSDSSGKYISNIGVLSEASAALKSYKTSFRQDLNGDGVIGTSAATGPTPAVNFTNMSEDSNNINIVRIKGIADANSQIKVYDGTTSLGTLATSTAVTLELPDAIRLEWPKLAANTNVSLRLLLLLYRKSSPPVPVSVLVLLAARNAASKLVAATWPVLSISYRKHGRERWQSCRIRSC